ncbi:nickel pincer cofactor biosynthesis protein LarC [Candidatus Bathyarchaeota archaeon]|nr:nickel pincer cofactor biosynthesis protein LarC [Candidatus Bathyarchaeota archaeon]
MKVLYIDCSLAGISGDMMLSALLNLGAELDLGKLSESIKESMEGVEHLNITYNLVRKQGFRAGFLKVDIEDSKRHRTGLEVRNALEKTLESMGVSCEAKVFAMKVIDTILKAESMIHDEPVEHLHLHEMASPDTLVDIAGIASALDRLNIFKDAKVYGSPVAVGSGMFKTEHGYLVSPAPATLEILKSRRYPFKGGPVEGELATPTGVAVLVNLVDEPVYAPPLIKPFKVGYGAGFKDLPGLPNILRLIYGESPLPYVAEEVYILETNLDDVSGEVLGHTVDRLMKAGARDVCIIPSTTKKNRPGYVLKAITDFEKFDEVLEAIFTETGTLGVRVLKAPRYVVSREIKSVRVRLNDAEFSVRVKVARDLEGRLVRVKPEYEDLKKISESIGVPVRTLSNVVWVKVKDKLEKEV